jgi:hypothetical protein
VSSETFVKQAGSLNFLFVLPGFALPILAVAVIAFIGVRSKL